MEGNWEKICGTRIADVWRPGSGEMFTHQNSHGSDGAKKK